MPRQDLIIDVGMNKAEDTRFYLAKGFTVVAIEANPQACAEVAARHQDDINSGRLTIINAAIFERDGQLTFFRNLDQPARSTLYPELMAQWAASGERFEEVIVPGLTFDEVLNTHGAPRYPKINIEGADRLCIEAVARRAEKPDFLSFEVEFRTLDAVMDVCAIGGARGYQLVSQMNVPSQTAPENPRVGKYAAANFEVGCTGLFDAELPGEWVSDGLIRREAARIATQHRAANAVRKVAGVFGAREPADAWVRRAMPQTADWYDVHVRFN